MKFSIGIQSLLIQLGSLVITFLVLSLIRSQFQIGFSLLFFLFLHAVVAASFSLLLKYDWWWAPIQFLFPLSAYFLFQQDVSPHFYLLILVLLSAIFWSTYRSQVPYYPSRSELLSPLLEQMSTLSSPKFIDIGSGMGGLLIKLSEVRPDGQFVGIEIAPLPWFISYLRGLLKRSRVQFKLGNFYQTDLAQFDVVFCYLSPAAMPSVWQKVKLEMRPGSLFLSYEFIVPDVIPDIVVKINFGGVYLYGWRV